MRSSNELWMSSDASLEVTQRVAAAFSLKGRPSIFGSLQLRSGEAFDRSNNLENINNATEDGDGRRTEEHTAGTPVVRSKETENQIPPTSILPHEDGIMAPTRNRGSTTENGDGRTEKHIAGTPVVHSKETENQITPSSVVTNEDRNMAAKVNRSSGTISKALFKETRGRGAGAAAGNKFITSQQLVSGAAKTRLGRKKAQLEAAEARVQK